MGKAKLDECYIFGISITRKLFDVSIDTKILFFRIVGTIEPCCSLLAVHYHEVFKSGLSRKSTLICDLKLGKQCQRSSAILLLFS